MHTPLLNAPEGVSLLFADSNPLLGIVLWVFRPLLPGDAQYVGPWMLLCLFLHLFFSWKLLRPHARGDPAVADALPPPVPSRARADGIGERLERDDFS